MLLQLLSEIYAAVIDDRATIVVYENFKSICPTFFDVLRSLHRHRKPIKIRYLGLSGYHWYDIESELTVMLTKEHVTDVCIDLIVLDYNWAWLEKLGPQLKNQVPTTREWVTLFSQRYGHEIRTHNWSLKVNTYRGVPQIWGICINDITLFRGTSYWDQIASPNGAKTGKILRAGYNPIELITYDDGRFGQERINEFIEWFEYYKRNDHLGIYNDTLPATVQAH
jgi:hypothetical protein